MNRYLAYAILPAALSLITYNAMAADLNHDDCGGTETIQVERMGAVDEATLQQHIDLAQERLKNQTTRGYWTTKRETQRHLNRMHEAMIRLHDQMVKDGCSGAAHGASLGTRVSALEKRMDTK